MSPPLLDVLRHLFQTLILVRYQEIETWVQALAYYDNNEFQDALMTFEKIADTSKILFNCGVIHASLGSHKLAVGLQKGSDLINRC